MKIPVRILNNVNRNKKKVPSKAFQGHFIGAQNYFLNRPLPTRNLNEFKTPYILEKSAEALKAP